MAYITTAEVKEIRTALKEEFGKKFKFSVSKRSGGLAVTVAIMSGDIDLSSLWASKNEGDYGFGYMIMNRFGDFTLTGHGGSNEGWHSGFMLDLKSKSGIIILTNGSNGRRVLFRNLQTWAQWHGKNLKN